MKWIFAVVLLGCFVGCSSPTAPTPYDPSHFYGLLGSWKSDRRVTDSEYFVLDIYKDRAQQFSVFRLFSLPDTLSNWTTAYPDDPKRGNGSVVLMRGGYDVYDATDAIDSIGINWGTQSLRAYPHGDTLRARFYSPATQGATFNFIRIPAIDSII